MKLRMNSKVAFHAIFVLFLMFVLVAIEVIATTSDCNPHDLNPCADVIKHSKHNVSDACCKARNKQTHECLCVFMKDPNLQRYVHTPGAVKISKVCNAPYPNCTS
ncbi:hypothetical protein OROGR_001985 [Orobanche gracilis]